MIASTFQQNFECLRSIPASWKHPQEQVRYCDKYSRKCPLAIKRLSGLYVFGSLGRYQYNSAWAVILSQPGEALANGQAWVVTRVPAGSFLRVILELIRFGGCEKSTLFKCQEEPSLSSAAKLMASQTWNLQGIRTFVISC